jgi:hypothetical protein
MASPPKKAFIGSEIVIHFPFLDLSSVYLFQVVCCQNIEITTTSLNVEPSGG